MNTNGNQQHMSALTGGQTNDQNTANQVFSNSPQHPFTSNQKEVYYDCSLMKITFNI